VRQCASIRDGTREQEGRSSWIGQDSVKVNSGRKGTARVENGISLDPLIGLTAGKGRQMARSWMGKRQLGCRKGTAYKMDRIDFRSVTIELVAFLHKIEGMTRVKEIGSSQARDRGSSF
jgi:hypothetical protein